MFTYWRDDADELNVDMQHFYRNSIEKYGCKWVVAEDCGGADERL
jgi:hypothetical protein